MNIKINCTLIDRINLVIWLFSGLISPSASFKMLIWTFACWGFHVAFSNKKYKKLREDLFN